MTTLREAAQQALEALENGAIARPGWVPDYDAAITALRAALAEQAQPVAWRDPSNTDPGQGCTYVPAVRDKWPHIFTQPLYTTPPAQQPLTIERLRDALVASRVIDPGAVEDPDNYDDGVMFGRIEALFRRIA